MSTPSAAPPITAALACIVVGLLVGVLANAIAGAVIAGLGIIPSCWGAWVGMQKETQGTLGLSILLALASLGVAGLIIIIGVVGLFT
jgi:hypothetical protein